MQRRAAWLSLVWLLVSGCGFQLQGRASLTGDTRVVLQVADNRSAFALAMRRALLQAGGRVAASDPTPGSLRLSIERDELLERVASVSALNQPREYELTYIVRFSLSRDGVTLVESEEISVVRDFSFDERVALAKARERELLRESLAAELANVILQRVASLR